MLYRCHQCFGEIAFEEIAHCDLYADLCWIQCTTCAAAFGPTCGLDRKANPHRHGYFACPLRRARFHGDLHGAFVPVDGPWDQVFHG